MHSVYSVHDRIVPVLDVSLFHILTRLSLIMFHASVQAIVMSFSQQLAFLNVLDRWR